jgi:virginiamycin B lyase
MWGTNRTIVRLARTLALGALIAALAAVAPAVSAARTVEPLEIEGARSAYLPERTYGNSVAVAPDGTAWFGAGTERGLVLAHMTADDESVRTVDLSEKARLSTTYALRFDPQGNLWFARLGGGSAILRRTPTGAVSTTKLRRGGWMTGLAIGPEGDVWFTRGHRESAAIGHLTAAGKVTQTPLARGSLPASVVVGPDGNAWFTERNASKIGRITPAGEVQLFPLGRGAHPVAIVAGADGALWFSEKGRVLADGTVANRIGRITTSGQVSEFPIPFGHSTRALAADPRGLIWFATDGGEISSISTAGAVGARGCFRAYCPTGILGLALAPDGTLWFAAEHEGCAGCGGGSVLIHAAEGTEVGEIPAGALEPAPTLP